MKPSKGMREWDMLYNERAELILQQLQLSARLGHTPAQTAAALADSAVRRAGQRQDDITVAVLKLDRH